MTAGVSQICEVHDEPVVSGVEVAVNSIYAAGIEAARPSLQSMYFISFVQQELG
jgi:hypothetical protein